MKLINEIKISGLSTKETQSITQYQTMIDKFKFMIPFTTTEYIEIIENLKNSVPFKYILIGKEYIINKVEYKVLNDYLILQFLQ